MKDTGLFIIMTGLPGSGKSSLARKIAAEIKIREVEILDGDLINRQLYRNPSYSRAELAFLHKHIHGIALRSLAEGKIVIYDATNILEVYRNTASQIAVRANAHSLIVEVIADEHLIRKRLKSRHLYMNDNSEADFSVYIRMKEQFEPVSDRHITIQSEESGFTNLDDLFARIRLILGVHELRNSPK